jgi:hypothetical protein
VASDEVVLVGDVVDETPLTDTDTVSMPPGPLGPSIISVLSVFTSPSIGLCVPALPAPFLFSHVIGVNSAPPRLSSEPKDEAEGFEAGFPQEMERGSSLPVVVNEVPFERTVRDEGSGIAGGRGKVCAPDVT